jgi:hypothetical protein
MDRSVFWRAALLQAVLVAVVAVALAVALPKSFFEDWGWLAGPGAWAVCALITGRVLGLAWAPVLAGAALAGVPSLISVAIGVHWLGAPFGVLIFGAWCARLACDRGLAAKAI